jgi:hypothetical protein
VRGLVVSGSTVTVSKEEQVLGPTEEWGDYSSQ